MCVRVCVRAWGIIKVNCVENWQAEKRVKHITQIVLISYYFVASLRFSPRFMEHADCPQLPPPCPPSMEHSMWVYERIVDVVAASCRLPSKHTPHRLPRPSHRILVSSYYATYRIALRLTVGDFGIHLASAADKQCRTKGIPKESSDSLFPIPSSLSLLSCWDLQKLCS